MAGTSSTAKGHGATSLANGLVPKNLRAMLSVYVYKFAARAKRVRCRVGTAIDGFLKNVNTTKNTHISICEHML